MPAKRVICTMPLCFRFFACCGVVNRQPRAVLFPILARKKSALSCCPIELFHRELDFRPLHVSPDVMIEPALLELRPLHPATRAPDFHVHNPVSLQAHELVPVAADDVTHAVLPR